MHPPRRPIAHALSGEPRARARRARALSTGWPTSPTLAACAADRGVLSSLRVVPKRGDLDAANSFVTKTNVTRLSGARAAQANGTNPFLPFFLDALEVSTSTVVCLVQLRELTLRVWIAERERPLRAAVSRPSALLTTRDARGATTRRASRAVFCVGVSDRNIVAQSARKSARSLIDDFQALQGANGGAPIKVQVPDLSALRRLYFERTPIVPSASRTFRTAETGTPSPWLNLCARACARSDVHGAGLRPVVHDPCRLGEDVRILFLAAARGARNSDQP